VAPGHGVGQRQAAQTESQGSHPLQVGIQADQECRGADPTCPGPGPAGVHRGGPGQDHPHQEQRVQGSRYGSSGQAGGQTGYGRPGVEQESHPGQGATRPPAPLPRSRPQGPPAHQEGCGDQEHGVLWSHHGVRQVGAEDQRQKDQQEEGPCLHQPAGSRHARCLLSRGFRDLQGRARRPAGRFL